MAKKANKNKTDEQIVENELAENRVTRPTSAETAADAQMKAVDAERKAERAIPAEETIWMVNPSGALHQCTHEHATERYKKVGWREATVAEIAELKKRHGLQRFDDPIAQPFSPDAKVK